MCVLVENTFKMCMSCLASNYEVKIINCIKCDLKTKKIDHKATCQSLLVNVKSLLR